MKFNTIQISQKGIRKFDVTIDGHKLEGVREVEFSAGHDSLPIVRLELFSDDVFVEVFSGEVQTNVEEDTRSGKHTGL